MYYNLYQCLGIKHPYTGAAFYTAEDARRYRVVIRGERCIGVARMKARG